MTLSSAVVYIEKEEGLIVANCHKLPGTAFFRHLLTLEQCEESLRRIAGGVREYNPECLAAANLVDRCQKQSLAPGIYDEIPRIVAHR